MLLVLIWPKMSQCVQTLKEKNKLTSFCIDAKLLKNIWTNIEDFFSNIEILNQMFYQFLIIDI